MLHSIFGKTLWDQRRTLVAWVIGITVVGAFYAAFYPFINNPEMRAALEAYPQGLLDAIGFTDVTSPAGYVGSTTFGILGPALIVIMGAALGGSAVAGDEEAGRLDLILAHPASRWSLVIQRFAALVVAMIVVCAVLTVALLAIAGPAGLESIGAPNMAAGAVHLVLLGTVFGALALAVGAATGRRSIVYAFVAVVAIVGYFGNNLGPSVDWLAWLQDVSPFHYYSGGQPLRDGLQVADAGVLAVVSLVLVAAGGLIFDRRDVAV